MTLHKDADEIHAPSLRYTPGPPDHTGQFQLLATGPGWLRGEMADRPGQQLEARWREKLEARPQDQNQVISLIGGATLNFQAMGQLDAQDIHFWLHELPPEKPPSPSGTGARSEGGFQPDRLLAEGNVVGNSPQFSARVQRLETWFTTAAAVASGVPPSRRRCGSRLAAPYVPSTIAGPALAGSPAARGRHGGPVPRRRSRLLRHCSAWAGKIRRRPAGHRQVPGNPILKSAAACCKPAYSCATSRRPSTDMAIGVLNQQHGDLTEVTVVDNVKLVETQTALPGDKPLLVTGQWLHATEANSPQSKVTVKGEPAHWKAAA